ncbi:MAG: DUF4982 domain-containing protein [Lachnospiraceae bacterium]|nr:DUF4982 domain-containing protein [Lachnospiraceae bacterium]
MAEKILWDDHWEFLEIPIAEGVEISVMPDDREMPQEGFRRITLPHDWLIEDAMDLYRDSIGWYRKTFTVHLEEDREYLVRFDGVYMDSAVYVNGKLAMEWKYGYSTFETDLTPYLVEGENQIVVRVVNQYLNTRWYSGAGIYRNVWWKERCRDHIVSDGIYITPRKVQDGLWKVEIDTELSLGAKDKIDQEQEAIDQKYILKQTILSPDGVRVAQDATLVEAGDICGGGETEGNCHSFPDGQGVSTDKYVVSQTIEVREPVLWDIGQGRLYQLVTELCCGDTLLETEEQSFGFRTIEFIPDKGFFINGRHEKIKGVCEHHDLGCLGAAFYKDAMRRKFHKLRAMGVNAIRTSHNMPAPEVMELADEMGFLIDSDAFDMWEKSKTPYDYGRFFKEWYAKDVASWIRRDRNHPSVIMWSIGNEIPDTVESAHGQEITAYLLKEVKRHDPKKHAPVTIASNYLKWDHAIACTELVELAGYNYSEYLYAKHHKEHPDWVIYGSETASVLASRGIYHFPKSRHILTEEDEQCSALGNSITGWGAVSYESCIIDDRDAPYSLGQFLWTGFDYIGESTPYQTKNSYFGQLDTAGFPKDSYYIFQAEWTDDKTAPMVHVFPYWDFNPGQMIDIQVCSNAPCVELFVNGRSMGRKEIDHRHGKKLVQCYQAAYEPGSIEAVAYDEEGHVIAREARHSFGDAVKIHAEVEEVGRLQFIRISVRDAEGYPVENANNRIFVQVTGGGRLLGLDNGDSTDFENYQNQDRRLFSGKLLAVVERTSAEKYSVKLSSYGLEGCELFLGSEEKSLSYVNQNQNDLPIRKIELTALESTHLTPEHPQVSVRVKLFPEILNSQGCDMLEWKAVNDAGIELPFVEIGRIAEGLLVSARHDGTFRLRVTAKNGKRSADIMSHLEMEASGFGEGAIDPYQEVLAALATERNPYAVEGIEHGINCLGEPEEGRHAVFGFERVDFGSSGTEEVTVYLFANTDHPVSLRIWDGYPGKEGSRLLVDGNYHKKPEWMVFQPESYWLSERLTGEGRLYFETEDAYQFKSFVFTEIMKAYERIYAADCDRIYGDAFQKTDTAVEKIGNNVGIVFVHLDLGTEGAERIVVTGRTPLPVQPIQIRWTVDAELPDTDQTMEQTHTQCIQMIEFEHAEEYEERIFTIETLRGRGTLEFIFLPGSSFDFLVFHFLKQEENG